jgi:hypothetical protein
MIVSPPVKSYEQNARQQGDGYDDGFNSFDQFLAHGQLPP